MFAAQNFAEALFSISLGTAVIPTRNEKHRLSKILVGKQGVLWEMYLTDLQNLPKCTLFAAQNFAEALFSISLGTAVIPTRNEKHRLSKILVGKQGVLWEMYLTDLQNIPYFLLAREEVETVKDQLVMG